MRILRWVLAGIVVAALVAFTGATVFRTQIAEHLFARAVKENIGRPLATGEADGIHVFICGSGTPMPDPMRSGPCIAIIAGSEHLVFDAGTGGIRTLTRMRYPVGELDAAFLTHLHSDHMDGLGELLMQAWINGGRDAPLPVYGPVGVDEVVGGFNAAYRIDSTYRAAHHGPEIANPAGAGGAPVPIALPAGPGGQAVVYDEGGVVVTAYKVDHAPVEPAFGYRIDYKGRSVSISGDTIYSPNLVAVSEGVDLLIHEALNAEMVVAMQAAATEAGRDGIAKIFGDILDYHATPADAARSAQEAGAGRLVFYHTIPPLPSRALNALFMKDAKPLFDGPMDVAEDGFLYFLPAESEGIELKKVL